jgi:hypothetical protein
MLRSKRSCSRQQLILFGVRRNSALTHQILTIRLEAQLADESNLHRAMRCASVSPHFISFLVAHPRCLLWWRGGRFRPAARCAAAPACQTPTFIRPKCAFLARGACRPCALRSSTQHHPAPAARICLGGYFVFARASRFPVPSSWAASHLHRIFYSSLGNRWLILCRIIMHRQGRFSISHNRPIVASVSLSNRRCIPFCVQDWPKVPSQPNRKISLPNLLTEQQCAIVKGTL